MSPQISVNTGLFDGLSPVRQAIKWTSAELLSIGLFGTNLWTLDRNLNFLFTKMHLKVLSAKWQLFCLGLKAMETFGRFFSTQVPHWRTSKSYCLRSCEDTSAWELCPRHGWIITALRIPGDVIIYPWRVAWDMCLQGIADALLQDPRTRNSKIWPWT